MMCVPIFYLHGAHLSEITSWTTRWREMEMSCHHLMHGHPQLPQWWVHFYMVSGERRQNKKEWVKEKVGSSEKFDPSLWSHFTLYNKYKQIKNKFSWSIPSVLCLRSTWCVFIVESHKFALFPILQGQFHDTECRMYTAVVKLMYVHSSLENCSNRL